MVAPKGHPPYNKNGEGGAPKIYTDEVIEKLADEFEKWMENPNNVWYKDFVLEKKLHPSHLVRWADKNQRFREALDHAKAVQESRMANGALKNKYNPGFTKFALMNNHGWSERTEQKISGDTANPFVVIMNQSKELVNGEETVD